MINIDKNILNAIETKFGVVDKVLHEAVVLHDGWDMDNLGWICLMADSSVQGFTTNHGSVCAWNLTDIDVDIKKTEESFHSLIKALRILKTQGN